jgi:hypothetical protein
LVWVNVPICVVGGSHGYKIFVGQDQGFLTAPERKLR